MVHTYTAGKLTQELKYEWISGVWDYTDRKTIHYSGTNADTILNEQYFYGPQVWDTTTREVYFYNAANDNDTLLTYDYYISLPHWRDPKYRAIHVYDNNHNRLSQTVQKYNGSSMTMQVGKERRIIRMTSLLPLSMINGIAQPISLKWIPMQDWSFAIMSLLRQVYTTLLATTISGSIPILHQNNCMYK
jgi:hypothetical protein